MTGRNEAVKCRGKRDKRVRGSANGAPCARSREIRPLRGFVGRRDEGWGTRDERPQTRLLARLCG